MYSVAELLNQEKEDNSTVKVFSDKVSLQKETGLIFGVLESDHPGQDLLLEYIIGQFKRHFINSDKLKKNKLENEFEEILQNINQNLTNYIQEKNILVDFDCLNMVVAILADKELYFTYLGEISAVLAHKIGKDNYKIIDILDNISGSDVKPNVFKIFSNVISGQIQNEYSLFFATTNILDYVNADRLKQFIVREKSSAALEEIKKIIKQTGKTINFSAILCKKNQAGVGNFLFERAKKEVEQSEISSISAEVVEPLPNEQPQESPAKEMDAIIVPSPELPPEMNIESEQKIEATIEEPEKPDIGAISDEEIQLKPENNFERLKKSLFADEKIRSKFSFKRFGQIILVIIFIIAAGLFIQNLKNKKNQQLAALQEQQAIATISAIEDKLTKINAKLIMSDKDNASQLITEVVNLLTTLPTGQKAKIEQYNNKLAGYLNQVRGVIEIKNPPVVAELANQADHLIKQAGSIYLYNSNNSIYRLDLATKDVKAIANNINDQGAWQKNTPDFDEGKTLLLYNGKGLSQYDFIGNELSAVDIPLAAEAKIDDLNFYGQKLYLLDSANNKIYRHTKLDKKSFNSGGNWLAEAVDLKGSVSMAIDSNIWVLKNNGEIIKLFKGKKENFQLKTIDPPLNNPTKIYTALEMDNIYILEPSGKRLIVIDKLGNLLGQYYSSQFNNLLDFVIDKDKDGKETGKVYLLNGLRVVEINTKK